MIVKSKDPKILEAAYKSLLPDNSPLPEDLDLKMRLYEDRLEITVIERKSLLRLANTVNNIIDSIETVARAIGASGGK